MTGLEGNGETTQLVSEKPIAVLFQERSSEEGGGGGGGMACRAERLNKRSGLTSRTPKSVRRSAHYSLERKSSNNGKEGLVTDKDADWNNK